MASDSDGVSSFFLGMWTKNGGKIIDSVVFVLFFAADIVVSFFEFSRVIEFVWLGRLIRIVNFILAINLCVVLLHFAVAIRRADHRFFYIGAFCYVLVQCAYYAIFTAYNVHVTNLDHDVITHEMDWKAMAERHNRVMEKVRKESYPNWTNSWLEDLTKPVPRIEVRTPRDGPVPRESFVIIVVILTSKITLLLYLIIRFAMTFHKRTEEPAMLEMVAIRENVKNEVEEKLLENVESVERRAAKKAQMIEDVD